MKLFRTRPLCWGHKTHTGGRELPKKKKKKKKKQKKKKKKKEKKKKKKKKEKSLTEITRKRRAA